jgi:hypothetical protein
MFSRLPAAPLFARRNRHARRAGPLHGTSQIADRSNIVDNSSICRQFFELLESGLWNRGVD